MQLAFRTQLPGRDNQKLRETKNKTEVTFTMSSKDVRNDFSTRQELERVMCRVLC